jgi:hypothetical protein
MHFIKLIINLRRKILHLMNEIKDYEYYCLTHFLFVFEIIKYIIKFK